LGLLTVAALTPASWEVEIVDENVEPIDFDTDADLIGMGPFNVQYAHALEIAEEFKRRGKAVVFGGPYCTLVPEAFEGTGAYRICGEAEYIWPQFLHDFESGVARDCYVSDGNVDLQDSPIPRYDLIDGRNYTLFLVQASRGCPFTCEFCDIIVTDGRVPRVKSIEQVVTEIDHCVRHGARFIFFSDANLIGNIPHARKLLSALVEYSKKNNFPVEFSCELTINLAHHEDLLALLHAANFTYVFVGIESPRRESLLETRKNQNTRRCMREDIERIQSYHISVAAGMIVGFDSDDRAIFQEQYAFLQEAGIPFTTCGTLVALPNTALWKRLEAEGRLLSVELTRLQGAGTADCNFFPKRMTLQDLVSGYKWLVRSLYSYESYSQRIVTLVARYRNKVKEHKRVSFTWQATFLPMLRILRYYLLTTDFDRFRFFTTTAWKTSRAAPFSMGKWCEFARWMAFYPSLRSFVADTHGVPEGADPASIAFSEHEVAITLYDRPTVLEEK
jgi:radical SAM superfamily enzyme YgiQ (UPF0313 family)